MNVYRPADGRRLLASLNCDGKRALWLFLGCALLLLPELAGDEARLALRYERHALAAGELWRLLTAHFVHLDLEHAALNTTGLILMWMLFAGDYTARQWLLIVVGAVAIIDAGLWLRDSTVIWYVGSSGVLHGIMAAGALARTRRWAIDGWILAAFLVGKLGYEQWAGTSPFLGADVPVVLSSHLYGAVGGLAAAAACSWLSRTEGRMAT